MTSGKGLNKLVKGLMTIFTATALHIPIGILSWGYNADIEFKTIRYKSKINHTVEKNGAGTTVQNFDIGDLVFQKKWHPSCRFYPFFFGDYEEENVGYKNHATVVIYGDAEYNTSRKIEIPHSIDGIIFLTEAERDHALDSNRIQRTKSIILGNLGYLSLETDASEKACNDAVNIWRTGSSMLALSQALELAKEHKAEYVSVQLDGLHPREDTRAVMSGIVHLYNSVRSNP